MVAVDKPDPAIFNLALDAVHATPDEAIHIGDSAWTDADLVRARRRCIAALPASPAGSLCTEQNWLGLRRVHGEYDCRMLLSVAQFCEVYQQAIRNRMARLS
jgi:beta-phosphoglucomutase-like phosphatase (HAD superfamily)